MAKPFYKKKQRKPRVSRGLSTKQKADVRKIVRKRQPWRYAWWDLAAVAATNSIGLTSPGLNYTGGIVAGNIDEQTKRSGSAIELRSLEFDGVLMCADATNVVRIIVARVDVDLTGTADFTNWFNNSHLDRRRYDKEYTILFDRKYALVGGASSSSLAKRIKFTLNLKKHVIEYKTVSTLTNDERKERLVLVATSDSGVAPNPSFVGQTTLWFKDKE